MNSQIYRENRNSDAAAVIYFRHQPADYLLYTKHDANLQLL
jgi:hypothetical protein